MSMTTRLLGLAFASADALIEASPQGNVTFAIGAGPATGEDAGALWVGKPLKDLLHQGDAAWASLANTASGQRTAPTSVMVATSGNRVRRAMLRAFVLPQLAPQISIALTYQGPAIAIEDLDYAPLLTPEAFLESAGDAVPGDRPFSFAFVDVRGLDDLDSSAMNRIHKRIVNTLQSAALGGSSAAQITSERFALLRDHDDHRDLAAEIREAGRVEGVELIAITQSADVAKGSDSLCVLRAMRFAIDGCLKEGGLNDPQLAFSEALKRTYRDAETFRTVVQSREFMVHYQPIVHLDSRAVHHFEALARFTSNNGPADAIRMAEELALVESFDLAVAEKVLMRMRQPGAGLLKMAVNVSGASLGDDNYVENLLRMTAASPEDRRRLIVEVTETSALADIAAANRRLAALREAGIKICIDDFGAGATSFDYLRRLSVDTVKIDGDIIRDIEHSERSHDMLKSIVALCQSMKLETIGEMIETEGLASKLKALGVTYGQGWLFGRPEAEPRTQLATPLAARRRGAVEAWG